MPSFRSRVLDALDIKKETVKVQVNERFPKTHRTDADGYALMRECDQHLLRPVGASDTSACEGVYDSLF